MAGVLGLIGGYFFKGPQTIGPRMQSIRPNLTLLELEIAKEILQEVFNVEPEDVEGMIQKRLVEG